MSKKDPKSELGRGIRALLSDLPEINKSDSPIEEGSAVDYKGSVEEIPLHLIDANPDQPRRSFDQNALSELATSLESQGLIQPITVRKLGKSYQIISGERRWRAAKLAGLKSVPAYVRVADNTQMLEMALIENIQREDLNAIEIAVSYQRLIEECSITHDELSIRVGKDRSTISNYLRLLRLPPEIQNGLQESKISMGHARALLSSSDVGVQLTAYKEILDKSLSVRNVEALMKSYNNPESSSTLPVSKPPTSSPEYRVVEEKLRRHFETKVLLKSKGKDKGDIIIPFYSVEDLNRILELLDE